MQSTPIFRCDIYKVNSNIYTQNEYIIKRLVILSPERVYIALNQAEPCINIISFHEKAELDFQYLNEILIIIQSTDQTSTPNGISESYNLFSFHNQLNITQKSCASLEDVFYKHA